MNQSTNRAIVKNGQLVTEEPITLPEGAEVIFTPVVPPQTVSEAEAAEAQQRIFEVLGRRHHSGQTDVAARHNEHQP